MNKSRLCLKNTDFQFKILLQNISVTKYSNPLATKPGNLTSLILKHIILSHFYLPYYTTFCFPMKIFKARLHASGAVIGTDMVVRNVFCQPPKRYSITSPNRDDPNNLNTFLVPPSPSKWFPHNYLIFVELIWMSLLSTATIMALRGQ
jgi:hypothetical protein